MGRQASWSNPRRNWYWLVDGLQAAGFVVHLANTTAIKKYDGLKHGGDETDARYLAHLLRLGILPTGTILPAKHREVHDLARKRMQLLRSRTSHILAVENITARHSGTRITSNQVKQLDQTTVDQLYLPNDVAVITTLSSQIAIVERRLQEKIAPRTDYTLLTTLPGIGQTLATMIVLETGTIERFASARNFASYARCMDSQCLSNGKKKGEGNTRNGNSYLGWAFIEATNFSMHFSTEARQFYERKKARTNSVIARKALAHKLARACFHMLKERKPCDVTRCFA
ncbi:transposase [Paraburkholderia kururiensis]|uniref:transposase n=1 Tax=Paraburkholderia kururiensis TaxID=984307 RepID=UPI000AB4B26B|nr:transposase [Paraburkholderia kururiensis]